MLLRRCEAHNAVEGARIGNPVRTLELHSITARQALTQSRRIKPLFLLRYFNYRWLLVVSDERTARGRKQTRVGISNTRVNRARMPNMTKEEFLWQFEGIVEERAGRQPMALQQAANRGKLQLGMTVMLV